MFDCLLDGENGNVQFWLGHAVGRRVISKVETARNTATVFGQDLVGITSTHMKDNVTHMLSDDIIVVCCSILNQAVVSVDQVRYRLKLLSGDIIQGR